MTGKAHAFSSAPASPEWIAAFIEERDRLVSCGYDFDRAAEIAKTSLSIRSPYETRRVSEDTEKQRVIAHAWRSSDIPPRPDFDKLAYECFGQAEPPPGALAEYRKLIETEKWRDGTEARRTKAEAEFAEDCIDMTGEAVDSQKAKDNRADSETIERQSLAIANRMREAGFDPFRPDNCRFWRYYIHTRHWEPLIQYRRLCFIPSVAASIRAPKLAALEYFLQENPFCRFWTFTLGNRVGTARVRQRARHLARRLNRLNIQLRRRYGVSIIFRATELGTVEFDANGDKVAEAKAGRIEFDENGEPLWHVHAHCVVYSHRGYIRPDKWKEMYSFIGKFWKYHWNGGEKNKDGSIKRGVIENPRECCKYVTKPGDILKLTGAQMVALQEALSGLRLVTPMGILRKQIAARKKNEIVLRRRRIKAGGRVVTRWRERIDHNKLAPRDDYDREGMSAMEDSRAALRELKAAARAMPGQTPNADEKRDFCRVMARLAPAMGPENFKEPSVMVCGTFKDEQAVANHPLVEKLWGETIFSWETRREAAAINVHTDTLTGQGAFDFNAHHPPEAVRWEDCQPLELAKN